MRIERPCYVGKLEERRENGSIKIVTGIRRCGKSYLLFNLYVERLRQMGVPESRIVRVALDDNANAELRNPDRLADRLDRLLADDDGMHYVMIDEVQYAISREELRDVENPPRIYGVLNGLLRRRNADVYVTGSNSKLLSSDVRTEFRGRGDEVRVLPLSFSEYLPAHGGTAEEAWLDYVTYGGLPHVLSFSSDEGRATYLTDLMDKVYLDDIVERNGLHGSTAIGSVVVGGFAHEPHQAREHVRLERRQGHRRQDRPHVHRLPGGRLPRRGGRPVRRQGQEAHRFS